MAAASSSKVIFLVLIVWNILDCFTGFQQNEYTIRLDRVEIISYNREIVNEFRSRTFKYNRTTTAFNMSVDFNRDLGHDVTVSVEAFRLASNEYRPFPITFNRNICKVAENNEFGLGDELHCGRMIKCPVKKGNYSTCNWIPDYTKFPPLIPSGGYAFELSIKYLSMDIATVRAYCVIVYPIRRPKV